MGKGMIVRRGGGSPPGIKSCTYNINNNLNFAAMGEGCYLLFGSESSCHVYFYDGITVTEIKGGYNAGTGYLRVLFLTKNGSGYKVTDDIGNVYFTSATSSGLSNAASAMILKL